MINLSSVGELSVAVTWSSSGYFSYYAYWSVKKQATLKATPSSAVVLQSLASLKSHASSNAVLPQTPPNASDLELKTLDVEF